MLNKDQELMPILCYVKNMMISCNKYSIITTSYVSFTIALPSNLTKEFRVAILQMLDNYSQFEDFKPRIALSSEYYCKKTRSKTRIRKIREHLSDLQNNYQYYKPIYT